MAKGSVLIVDDEEINRMLLKEYLITAEIDHAEASNGTEALEILNREPQRFSAVLLDRMMPDMDGLSVLKQIKSTESLKNIPVIMQTAKAMKEEVREGLECGSYYYLTKPFDKKTLLTVLKAAIDQFFTHGSLIAELQETSDSLSLLQEGRFELATLEEARNLSKLLALSCPQPAKMVTGISELLINAIEHGNMAIGFEEKTDLLKSEQLYEEINRRLTLDEYKDKRVTVEYKRSDHEIQFIISDCGDGFDYEKYLNIDLSEVLGSHGRGIAMARILSFSDIIYSAGGRQVTAILKLQ